MGQATFGRRRQLWLQEHTDINSKTLIYGKIWPNLLSSGQLQKQKSWANVSVALAKEDEAFQECARERLLLAPSSNREFAAPISPRSKTLTAEW